MLKRGMLIFLLMLPIVQATYEISYQGAVRTSSGQELASAQNLTIEVNESNLRLYNDTWDNGIHSIGDNYGFDVILGRENPLSVIYNNDYSLCAYVNSELQGSCYTFRAGVGNITNSVINTHNITGDRLVPGTITADLLGGSVLSDFIKNGTDASLVRLNVSSLNVTGGAQMTYLNISKEARVGNAKVNISSTGDINMSGELHVGGKVGIGTNSPDYKLEVESSTPDSIAITDTGSGVTTRLTAETLAGTVGTVTSHVLGFVTDSTYRAQVGVNGGMGIGNEYGSPSSITPPAIGLIVEGNVGIGTATPNHRLDVNGNINASNLTIGAYKINLSSTGDVNATKFYGAFVGDGSGLTGQLNNTYVPYTGATQNVDLINNNLTTSGQIEFGYSNWGILGYEDVHPVYGAYGYAGDFETDYASVLLADNDYGTYYAIDAYGNSRFEGNITVINGGYYGNGSGLTGVLDGTKIANGTDANLITLSTSNLSATNWGAQFGNGSNQYWKVEQFDLSPFGIDGSLPMLSPYSDSIVGNVGAIKQGLYIMSVPGVTPQIAFYDTDGGTLGTFWYSGGIFNTLQPLTVNGNIVASGSDVSGNSFTIGGNILESSEWGYLDGLDQALKTTDTPTFSTVTATTFIGSATDGTKIANGTDASLVNINGSSLNISGGATIQSLNVTNDLQVRNLTVNIGTGINEVNLSGVLYVNGTARRVGIGILAPTAALDIVSQDTVALSLTRYISSGVTGSPISFRAVRGTPTAPSQMLANDQLWGAGVSGYHGGNAFTTGGTRVYTAYYAGENWNDATHNGVYISWGTTHRATGGSGSTHTHMALTPSGTLWLGEGDNSPVIDEDFVEVSKLHLDMRTATPVNMRFTANATTGRTATDGFTVGINATGVAELRQWENLPMEFYVNNTLAISIVNSSFVNVTGNAAFGNYKVNISSTGDVNATKFYGDGSGLTGVNGTDSTKIANNTVASLSYNTQIGDDDDYLKIEQADLGGYGAYAELNGYSTGGYGNTLSMADFLVIRDKANDNLIVLGFLANAGDAYGTLAYYPSTTSFLFDKPLSVIGNVSTSRISLGYTGAAGEGLNKQLRLSSVPLTGHSSNNDGSSIVISSKRCNTNPCGSGGTTVEIAQISGILTDTTSNNYQGELAFYTALNAAPQERMRLNANGSLFLGIGLANMTYRLEVNGSARFNDSGGAVTKLFIGDGKVNISSAGDVNATKFYGDGSALTGVGGNVNGTDLNLKWLNVTRLNVTTNAYFGNMNTHIGTGGLNITGAINMSGDIRMSNLTLQTNGSVDFGPNGNNASIYYNGTALIIKVN